MRTILLVLDTQGTQHAAIRLVMHWAQQHGAMLVGQGIVDPSVIAPPEAVPLGASQIKRELDATKLAQATAEIERTLSDFAVLCSQAQVPCKLLETTGTTVDEIATQAQRYDLIVLPRRVSQGVSARQLGFHDLFWELLHGPPRPVTLVPETARVGTGVLIAYDGSLQAARALQAAQQSGLLQESPTHILSLDDDRLQAAQRGDRAVDFLSHHGISAQLHVDVCRKSPGECIVQTARDLQVGLLVLGAYGQPKLREFFLGSTTRDVLSTSDIPLFLYH